MRFYLTILVTVSVLLPLSSAWALKECPGSPLETSISSIPSSWHNCEGTFMPTGKRLKGVKYVGEWRDGMRNGQGTMTWGKNSEWAGDTYVGGWKDGKMNGQGTYTYAGGNKYVGGWKDGESHGQGVRFYVDGRVWDGQWKDNEWVRGKKYAKGEYKGSAVADNSNRQNEQNQEAVERERSRSSEERRQRELAEQEREQLQREKEQAETDRIALLIGNQSYKNSPLTNPISDITLISKALKDHGFTVLVKKDVNYKEFRESLEELRQLIQKSDKNTAALFYYAGHGLQFEGTNYLVPISSTINNNLDIETETINVSRILSSLYETSGVKIVLLDACRNNPYKSFVRAPSRGLAQISTPTGTIIGYSTAPGKVAEDGLGENGPYAVSLFEAINTPGLTIEQVLKQTRVSVIQKTGGSQVPWDASSLTKEFYFLQ